MTTGRLGTLERVSGLQELEGEVLGWPTPTDLCPFSFFNPSLVEIMPGQEIHVIDWLLRPSFMAAFSQ